MAVTIASFQLVGKQPLPKIYENIYVIEGYNELIFNFFEYAWVAIIRATVFLNDLIDQERLDESK